VVIRSKEFSEMEKTVVALFGSYASAEHGLELLQQTGFLEEQIGIVAHSDVVREHLGEDQGRAVLQTIGAGAVGGSLFGGLAGLLTGAVALVLPGIGPVIAGGAIATVLGAAAAGAGIGAAFGSLAGALIGLGMSEEQAHIYIEGVRHGNLLVVVETEEEHVQKATNTLQQADALDVSSWSGRWDTELAGEEAAYGTRNDSPETIHRLGALLETCLDSEAGLRTAAKHFYDIEDDELGDLLQGMARKFEQFAATLREQIERLNDGIEERGSVSEAIQHGWTNIEAAMTIEHEQTKQIILSSSKDVLAEALKSYREALDAGLSASVQPVIEEQYRQIQEAHQQVADLEQATQR
jgi:uncharacterized protein (TIGR02284 family)